jgi:hypothetical protein
MREQRDMGRCDPVKIEAFDYSCSIPSSPGYPDRRNAPSSTPGIYSAKDLAQRTRDEVAKLHGIGPSAFPILDSVLQANGLKFKSKL